MSYQDAYYKALDGMETRRRLRLIEVLIDEDPRFAKAFLKSFQRYLRTQIEYARQHGGSDDIENAKGLLVWLSGVNEGLGEADQIQKQKQAFRSGDPQLVAEEFGDFSEAMDVLPFVQEEPR